MTVPSNPTNGALEPTVARNERFVSMESFANCAVLAIRSSAAAAPLSAHPSPAMSTRASIDDDVSSRSIAPTGSRTDRHARRSSFMLRTSSREHEDDRALQNDADRNDREPTKSHMTQPAPP